MTCKVCGEQTDGDGYTTPVRCPDAPEDWWYSAPDEGPFYCEYREYREIVNLDQEGE